ncbi:uncharacterized protein LOC127723927 [Mytilus californianus]|uniref:uncharacterized protein LOC127723927 n=1 Tax=Mytilus californianus TaxID=6549 RepID=UPI0022478C82|nr:uncharacterized protein LOC127723927 [Mytilus californianus]
MDSNLIRCKRVTKEDYEKVMAIFPPSEIYNGGDSLPDYFHMLIDLPNNEMYAAVIGDKFVGFTLMTTVDDGRSIVTRAVRVSKEYAGKGIAGIMLKWMDIGQPLYRPEVIWHKITGNRTHSPLLQLINKGTYNKISQQLHDKQYKEPPKGQLKAKETKGRIKNVQEKSVILTLVFDNHLFISTDTQICNNQFQPR